ncbi:MAG: hypothetical protein J6S71_00330 [Clostridia bacterium]|nr:hypothetical protein [Clostridia bacterium]
MNLLYEGIEAHIVEKTTLTRKLTVDGITKAYPVYKIRLDALYYNDQNDRIATWIAQYKSQNGGKSPNRNNKEDYNNIIENFIYESNPDSINKTQKNIELVDQREPGVVLSDGRIIDGNRRYTCLRRLSSKSDRFNYFEAVILDRNIESDAKQIKMLELSIQHGEESKVDYNAVDRLVGIYHDIIETNLLTIGEYARSTNETESEVKTRIEVAKLMVEFLEFINAPLQFHIARDLQLYYPIEELYKLTKKCHTEDEIEDLKNAVFTNILLQPSTDMTRFVRNIKSIVGSDYQNEFFEEQTEIAAKVIESLPVSAEITSSTIREVIRTNNELVGELERSMEKSLTKVKKNETRNRPIQLVEKATTFLESVDTNIIFKMNDSELRRFERQLEKLENVVASIRENL